MWCQVSDGLPYSESTVISVLWKSFLSVILWRFFMIPPRLKCCLTIVIHCMTCAI